MYRGPESKGSRILRPPFYYSGKYSYSDLPKRGERTVRPVTWFPGVGTPGVRAGQGVELRQIGGLKRGRVPSPGPVQGVLQECFESETVVEVLTGTGPVGRRGSGHPDGEGSATPGRVPTTGTTHPRRRWSPAKRVDTGPECPGRDEFRSSFRTDRVKPPWYPPNGIVGSGGLEQEPQ